MEKRKINVFRIVLLVIGAILIIQPISVLNRMSFNMGVIMPLVIGTPLLIIGIFYDYLSAVVATRIGKILKIGIIAVYAIFICLFTVTSVIITVKGEQTPQENADVLIVLGSGIRGESVSLTLARRLEKAAEYLRENENTVCIVSGGMGGDETVTEAYAMKKYLTGTCNIPTERIIMEDKASSTKENFELSYKIICDKFGEDASIVFVTTKFHVFRAEMVANKLGIETTGIGSRGAEIIILNDYMRECAAITQYVLTGKI